MVISSSALMATHALTWISSVVVMGITAWYISFFNGADLGRQVNYIITVSVLSTLVYPIILVLSRREGRHGMMVANLVMSYLWLAVVVVATDLWANAVAGQRLHAALAFSYIAFVCTAVSTIIEGYILPSHNGVLSEKRPRTASTDVAGGRAVV